MSLTVTSGEGLNILSDGAEVVPSDEACPPEAAIPPLLDVSGSGACSEANEVGQRDVTVGFEVELNAGDGLERDETLRFEFSGVGLDEMYFSGYEITALNAKGK